MKVLKAASAIALGTRKANKFKSKSRKPALTGKYLKKGMDIFSKDMSSAFKDYLYDKLENNYRIDVLDLEITKKELIDSAVVRDNTAVPKVGNFKNIPYREIWSFFEYGRMDKGVLPNRVLTEMFNEFYEVWKESLKEELENEKN